MKATLAHVCLKVTDLEKAVAFYREYTEESKQQPWLEGR